VIPERCAAREAAGKAALSVRFAAVVCGFAMSLAAAAGAAEIRVPVEDIVVARGLGRDALAIPGNIFRHRGLPVPLGFQDHVAAALDDPLSLPKHVRELVAAISRPGPGPDPGHHQAQPAWLPDALPQPFRAYLAAVAAAVDILTAALPDAFHRERRALLAEVTGSRRHWPRVTRLATEADRERLAEAASVFLSAQYSLTATEALAGLAAGRFSSPLGDIVVGTHGNDEHASGAAIIVDPGGDDVYVGMGEAARVSVIVDLAGDDRYAGDAPVVGALTAIIDRGGNDDYRGSSGFAATVAGASLVIDRRGDDRYRADVFGLAAAVLGTAILIDEAGDDHYRIGARGQGFGGPMGHAVLWDRAGDDVYSATAGLSDPFRRSGGRLSEAQGFARGVRSDLAGGIAILRDDGGNDHYAAEMFAQGSGYYYGTGLLLDEAGHDSYAASRYAQGQGSHGGLGFLRDTAGDDRYRLAVGVGQGMGLDFAVGFLVDSSGDDIYAAPNIAQGATTANGMGLLFDGAGTDRYALDPPGNGWGRGHAARGLPGLAFLVDADGRAAHRLGDTRLSASQTAAGGPLAARDAELGPPPEHACPVASPRAAEPMADEPLALLARAAPVFGRTEEAIGAYSELFHRLPAIMPTLLDFPPGDIALAAELRNLVRCYLTEAEDGRRDVLRTLFRQRLHAAPLSRELLRFWQLAGGRPDLDLAERVLHHPDCATRAVLLRSMPDADIGSDWQALAEQALADTCWQAQAAALDALAALGALEPAHLARVPGFLRGGGAE